MRKSPAKTLILGVGNILLSDEGIGVRVIEHLQQQDLPEGVELVDGGTAGADLIDVLADRETVIVVDAVRSDKPAGTMLWFGPDDLSAEQDNALSLHDLDIPQTLAMTKMLNCAPTKIIFLGIVPECFTPGMELSQTLASLLPQIAQTVLGAVPKN
jgi:hydrogenase maturation protease